MGVLGLLGSLDFLVGVVSVVLVGDRVDTAEAAVDASSPPPLREWPRRIDDGLGELGEDPALFSSTNSSVSLTARHGCFCT